MKRLLYILFMMIGFYSVGIGQITVNTNFTPNIAGHIDSRCVLTNLADTSTISFKYEGMLIYVAVLNKFYYYETYWKELASETLIDSYVSNNGYLTGIGTTNYLPVWGGATYLTYSSGTGFVKVTNGNISYDNSTYLTAEVDGSTSNEIQEIDTFEIYETNKLRISLEGDGQPFKTITLPAGSDTQDLSLDSLSRVFTLTLTNGGTVKWKDTDTNSGGTVTAVTGTSPINSSGGNTPAISIDLLKDLVIQAPLTGGAYNNILPGSDSDVLIGADTTSAITGLVTKWQLSQLSFSDTQDLSLDSLSRVFTLSLTNGGSVKFKDTDTQLSESQVDSYVSDNGYLTSEVDGSTSNEVQTLAADSTSTTIGITSSINNSRVHFTVLKSEVDGSITNEIQKIDTFQIYDTNKLRISLQNDNEAFKTVTLPAGSDTQDLSLDSLNRVFNLSLTDGGTVKWKDSDSELPTQTGNNGKYLQTNGTSASWQTAISGVASSNVLPVGSGATSITTSSGTGFVKVASGNISYDNSTYLTAEVDGSTSNEIQKIDTFRIVNTNKLQISLQNDGERFKEVTLPNPIDSTGMASGYGIYAYEVSPNTWKIEADTNEVVTPYDLNKMVADSSQWTKSGNNIYNKNTGNIFLGYIRAKSDAYDNTFIGKLAGEDNTAINSTNGYYNTFVGSQAGKSNTIGYANSSFGYNAGYYNTEGDANTWIGYQSGINNTTGSYNVGLGVDAGYSNNANNSVYIGFHSGKSTGSITGADNNFIGSETATKLSSGYSNNVLGKYGGYNLTTGYNNTIIGSLSGYALTTGYNNTLIGKEAGQSIKTGTDNFFMGFRSGYNATAYNNVGVGSYSLFSTTSGAQNTAIGDNAGFNITTGSKNTFIGEYSGNIASQKVDAINSTAIGSRSYTDKSNQIAYGDANIIEHQFRSGVVQINTVNTGTSDTLLIREGNVIKKRLVSSLPFLTEEVDGSITNELQTIDTFEIYNTNKLRISLSGDGQAYKTVDLPTYTNPIDSTTVVNAYGTIITESPANQFNITVDSSKFATHYDLTLKQNNISAGFGIGISTATIYNSRYWKNQDTVKTTLTGLLKATSGVLSAASAGTDYFVLPSLTSGSVLFSNGTTIAQDNTKFFWDNTNKRLGIGLATPAERLTIKGYQGTDFIGLNNELSTNNRTFRILAGIGGITYNGFSIYDTYAAATRLYISNTGNVGIGNYDDTYKLSVEGTFQVKTRTGTAVLGAAFDGVGKLVQMSGLPPMGAGKPNKIAYWQNDTTLTYSNYYHIDAANRRFGINNESPTDRLTITGYQTTDFIGLNNELSTNNRTFQLMAGYSGVGYNGFSIYDTYAAATRLHISNTGILRIPTLSTGLTAPSTSGTTKMVISDANGDLSFTAIPAAGITGTGTSNRVAFWTGASTIDDHAGFNYTSADSTMRVANLTVSRMGNNTAYATYISGHDSNGNFGRLDPTNGGLLAIGASGNIIDGRTIAAGSGISVSNGNGASGNPTITNTGVTSLNGKTGALTAVIGKGLKGNVAQSITTNALTTLQITSHANNIQQGTTVDATNEYIKVNSDNAGYYEITYNYYVRQTAQASAFELYSDIYLNGSTTPISDERIVVSLPQNLYQNVSYSTNMYLSDNDYVQVKTSSSQDVDYTIFNYVITIKKIQ